MESKFPFEAHIIDADRGGVVSVVVDESGEVVVKDCYGDIVMDVETALAVADHIQLAAKLKESARRGRRVSDEVLDVPGEEK